MTKSRTLQIRLEIQRLVGLAGEELNRGREGRWGKGTSELSLLRSRGLWVGVTPSNFFQGNTAGLTCGSPSVRPGCGSNNNDAEIDEWAELEFHRGRTWWCWRRKERKREEALSSL